MRKKIKGRNGRIGAVYLTENIRKVIKNRTVDYKNIPLLKTFISEQGKIIASSVTSVGAHFQRNLSTSIKRARFLGLLPYAGARHHIVSSQEARVQ